MVDVASSCLFLRIFKHKVVSLGRDHDDDISLRRSAVARIPVQVSMMFDQDGVLNNAS
jgi:hypothetical protein